MKNDLDLIGNRYTIIVVIFFPFYIIANPIATVLARKLGPRPFCSGITFAFGIVVIGFGLVHDWKDQVGLRVLLGLFEGGFFPSAVFLVSMYGLPRSTYPIEQKLSCSPGTTSAPKSPNAWPSSMP